MSRQILLTVLALTVLVSSVTGNRRNPEKVLHPRSIKTYARNRGSVGGSGLLDVGNPAEWTMSKANLVAEFFTSEPAVGSSVERLDRNQKSIFSFFSGNANNGSIERNSYGPPLPLRMAPPAPPASQQQSNENLDRNGNLVASGTNYNHQAIPFADSNRNVANILLGGGYATPFRPISFPQQNNYIVASGSPASGYPQNIRPPRGPPPPPTRQYIWNSQQIEGLKPPLPVNPPANHHPQQQQQQQQYQPPPPLYLPPQYSQSSPPQSPPSQSVQIPRPQPLTQNQPAPPQPLYPVPAPKNTSFTPSPQYPPENPPSFQPGSPSPQILDTYRNQQVYPLPQATEKPLVYVLANSSFDQSTTSNPSTFQYQTNGNPLNSYTQYENEPVPPPPVSSLTVQQQPVPVATPHSVQPNQPQQQQTGHSEQADNVNGLALTEPLSHILAEANAKAGEAMDKTIRFVIHKPEDEDIVKNAILEDAQNRYEDVKFVQGPTLKVQRKETVYLPPKKKTVVYILLKEPQIDTDVEVMSPQEDEPVPEVYITYQKSDGAVKTKHYSPKPIRQEDMKKYLDIEEDSYATGEESRFHPRFSKSTSVSLSTSSKVSRKTASTSSSVNHANNSKHDDKTSLLANHNLSPSNNTHASATEMKSSPLLYTSRSATNQVQISNSTSSVRLPDKKPRSSDFSKVLPSPRRVLRHHPIQCPPTVT